MRKNIKILFALFALLLTLSLCGCGFVSYIENADVETEDISSELEEYLSMIDKLSNEECYREDERREYILAILDAKNELRECKTIEELDAVFDKHSQIILAIPTDLDLTIIYMTERLREIYPQIEYRELEKKQLDRLFAEYLEKMQGISGVVDAEKLLNEFKTLSAGIKTDAQYDTEELVAAQDTMSDFGEDLDYSIYRSAERAAMQNTVSAFKAALGKAKNAEECFELLKTYTIKINEIPTAEELLEREQDEWAKNWDTRLSQFADKYSIEADAEMSELLKNIRAQKNSKDAGRLATGFMLSFADDIGDSAISDIKSIAKEYIGFIAVENNYRDAQKNDIKNIVSAHAQKIDSADNVASILAFSESAEEAIAEIKTNDELWYAEDHDFIARMQSKYGEMSLARPDTISYASSNKELAKIIDYYAFYQLNSESFERANFRVKLDFSHKYADYVIKDVYWYCELLRSAVGITGYFENDSSQLVITLIPYELASVSNTDKAVEIKRYDSLIEYTSDSALTERAEDFDEFPYYQKYAGRYITVWNSQQLWYALEHEYIPIPIEDSPAEIVLERAKEILRSIIKDGMTIEEKVFAIYSWYGDNVTYDNDYDYYLYVNDRDNFPDSMVSMLRSFHAEGALFDNLAVCCSYAKSCLILMRLEGIEAYRVILHQYEDNAIGNHGAEGYGSHAIIALKASDGKFYYCDVEQSSAGPELSYEKYHQLLVTAEEQFPYEHSVDRIWNELDYGEEFPMELFWGNITYNGKSIFVKSQDELRALIDDYIVNNTKENSQINIFCYNESELEIVKVLDTYENITYNQFHYNEFNEYMIHYTE